MKRLFYSLSGLGLISILVTGTAVGDARADHTSSPLRGTWSWSQFVPATTALGTPTPIPTAAAGTFVMAKDNSFTGHGVLNTPLAAAFEFDFNGTCTFRNGNVSNGMDCLVDVPSFRLSDIGRFCVAMAKNILGCFDEFRCVNTNEPGTVLLVEFRRQQLGTCK
ncbi:MAG TPA: hypothetical protein VGX03_12370 [Candidatus Binatia bacterium]|jgi:hypothetical protein|nr:hypothetical protein [Candidatus Binatia bacterium]